MIAPENYQPRPLGSFGLELVRSSLAEGLSLSRQIARTLDLDGGTVFTHLPEALPNITASTFRTGGVASVRVSEEIAVRFVFQEIVARQDVLVSENPIANCSDPWVRTRPLGVVCYVDELYQLGTGDGVAATSVAGALRAAHSIPDGQVSVVTAWPGELPTNWPHQLLDLGPLVEAVRLILVTAFDGEGYVIWQPK